MKRILCIIALLALACGTFAGSLDSPPRVIQTGVATNPVVSTGTLYHVLGWLEAVKYTFSSNATSATPTVDVNVVTASGQTIASNVVGASGIHYPRVKTEDAALGSLPAVTNWTRAVVLDETVYVRMTANATNQSITVELITER